MTGARVVVPDPAQPPLGPRITHPAWCNRALCEPLGVDRATVHKAHVTQISDGDAQVYAKLTRYQDDTIGLDEPRVELWVTDPDPGWWISDTPGVSAWLSLAGARRLHAQLGEQIALAEGVGGHG